MNVYKSIWAVGLTCCVQSVCKKIILDHRIFQEVEDWAVSLARADNSPSVSFFYVDCVFVQKLL